MGLHEFHFCPGKEHQSCYDELLFCGLAVFVSNNHIQYYQTDILRYILFTTYNNPRKKNMPGGKNVIVSGLGKRFFIALKKDITAA